MEITVATRYTIMRGLKTSCTIIHDVAEKPLRVVTLRNEAEFVSSGGHMTHHGTVFFEDEVHDWAWSNGQFRYFARQNDGADVVLVYAEEVIEREAVILFCPHCGVRIADHPDHDYKTAH